MSTNRDIRSAARRLLTDVDMAPLSARSLLLSYLLGTHPPDVPAARLVEFGALFGLRSGTVRTALSRMVAAGDASTDDGRYRLAGRLLDRQRELDRGQRPPSDGWDGTWWTVLVTADARSSTERRRFRSTMVGARFGELRPDTWMRPTNTGDHVADDSNDPDTIVTRGHLVDGDDAALAHRLWDLPSIESRSGSLLDVLGPLGAALTESPDERDELLPLTFEVSAACVRHLRTEPQLPSGLVDTPASRRLRAVYADVNRAFQQTLDEHLRERAPTLG